MKISFGVFLTLALALIGLLATTDSLPAQEVLELRGSALQRDEVDLPQLLQDGPVTLIMALDADGTNLRTVGSIPQFPIINSPEVSPDGEWIGVDGWKHGQTNVDAHLLLIHLKTGIVSDLGKGAMPTWSADGRWIAFSRYRGGCFIGRVNQERERQIEPSGWRLPGLRMDRASLTSTAEI